MLRELSKKDWLASLKISEKLIPEVLILRGTRQLKKAYISHRDYFSNVVDLGGDDSFVDDVFIGEWKGQSIAYASVYGAPMASEIVHIFGTLGTKMVLQTGSCGGISNELDIGNFFVASNAYPGEGASQYYGSNKKMIASTLPIDEFEEARKLIGNEIYHGDIFTTSALLAEGNDEIEAWDRLGFSAVDMETSTTFSVANYFGMDRGAILLVSDHPKKGEHLLQPEVGNQQQIDASLSMTEIAIAIVESYLSKPR